MNGKKLANCILCLVLTASGIAALAVSGSALTPKGLFMAEIPDDVAGSLKLTSYEVREQKNNIVSARFTVSNTGETDAGEIRVSCDFSGEQGTFVDRETWLLPGILPAGERAENVVQDRRYIHTGANAVKCMISAVKKVGNPIFSISRTASGHGSEQRDGSVESGGGH